MSIRPVDMQILLPKSTEVNNPNNSKSEIQQHHFTQHMNKQIEHANQSVIQTSESDHKNNINKDGRNKEEQSKNKKKGTSKYTAKEDKQKHNSTTMFDVTI